MTITDKWRGITLLILFSLAVRVTWAAVQPSDATTIDRLPDQREYLSLGQNLLHGDGLQFFDSRFNQTLYAYRTPGYPAFIALMGGRPRAIRIAQAIIDSSTVLAIYLLAQHLSRKSRSWCDREEPLESRADFDELSRVVPARSGATRPGSAVQDASQRMNLPLLAAAFVAVNPFLIYFCGLILSETLFTALLAWAILLLVRGRILWTAILFLLAVYVRPSAVLLGPLLAACSVLLNPPPGASYPLQLRRAAIAVVTVLCVIIIGLMPWTLRNHRILGHGLWTTSNDGMTLYDGFNPTATGASDQRFIAEMPQLSSMNEVERSEYLRQQAGHWIRSNPSRLPALTLEKIIRTWSPVPLSEEYGRTLHRFISAAYELPVDGLILAGLFWPGLRRPAKMLLVIPAIYFTIVHAMSVGSLRYRVPIEPELAVLAASGLLSLVLSAGGTPRLD